MRVLGIPCDQSVWGDITIYTSDGARKELGSFEFLKPQIVMAERARSAVPFCFTYGGVSSDLLLPYWDYSEEKTAPDKDRVQTVQTYRDPATGLELRCVRVDYSDFPISEWTRQCIRDFRFMDDAFMQVCFEADTDCLQEVLRIILDMPDLIEVQKNSYYRFLKEDLKEVLDDIFLLQL